MRDSFTEYPLALRFRVVLKSSVLPARPVHLFLQQISRFRPDFIEHFHG